MLGYRQGSHAEIASAFRLQLKLYASDFETVVAAFVAAVVVVVATVIAAGLVLLTCRHFR